LHVGVAAAPETGSSSPIEQAILPRAEESRPDEHSFWYFCRIVPVELPLFR
jgi:hypothetical protein